MRRQCEWALTEVRKRLSATRCENEERFEQARLDTQWRWGQIVT